MFNSKLGSILALVTILVLAVLVSVPWISSPEWPFDFERLSSVIVFVSFLPLAAFRVLQTFKHIEIDSSKVALDSIKTFKRSRTMMAAALCGAIGFVVAGYSMVKPSNALFPGIGDANSVIGWIAIGFFGLWLLAAVVALFRQGPVLKLSPAGINCSVFKVGDIDWQDICNVTTKKFMRSQIISLELRDPEKYFVRGYPKRARSQRLAGRFGMSPFSLSSEMFGTTAEHLLAEFMPRFRRFGAPATPHPQGSEPSFLSTQPSQETE